MFVALAHCEDDHVRQELFIELQCIEHGHMNPVSSLVQGMSVYKNAIVNSKNVRLFREQQLCSIDLPHSTAY